MPVVSSTPDTEQLTLTVVAEFAAPPTRVWEVWTDPRQLERWWGPPTWPATFVEHDVAVGGTSRYFMTGPEGERAHGWWRITAIDAPTSLEFEDGFADDAGTPSPDLPTVRAHVQLEQDGDGTRMTVVSRFATQDQMQQLIDMGMFEGMREAMGQIDALLLTRV
jgi:uncharacterized protein YndB with AHSA1/START domain